MHIDKNMLLNMLHGNNQHAEADQAAAQLPDQVDTEQHARLLSKLGIDPMALISKFTGGGGLGGAGAAGGLSGLLSSFTHGNSGPAEQVPYDPNTGQAPTAVDEEGESTVTERPADPSSSGGLGGLLGRP